MDEGDIKDILSPIQRGSVNMDLILTTGKIPSRGKNIPDKIKSMAHTISKNIEGSSEDDIAYTLLRYHRLNNGRKIERNIG